MCPCGGELTVWCVVHGDWVCDDCGCQECRDENAWGQEYADDAWEDDDHDERHPYWNEGCDACVERANWLEAQYQERSKC